MISSCGSAPTEDDDSYSTDVPAAEDTGNVGSDEFSDDFSDDFGTQSDQAIVPEQEAPVDEFDEFSDETDSQASQEEIFDDEFNQVEEAPQIEEFADTPPPPIIDESPVQEEAPMQEFAETPAMGSAVNITGLDYKANENGGTLVIEASGPATYTTRMNTDNNQLVVEVQNATLPEKLKRPLNTRDFAGTVGSIDAYQNPGSTTARIVVQLRPGAPEPVVSQEGNSILVMTSPSLSESVNTIAETPAPVPQIESTANDGPILPGKSLDDFLSGNTKFYGTPINIVTNEMDLKEALKFIADESGANLVISDDIKGTISLKLRQVPWDQALVVIMKARKLGYTRQGSILRIAPLVDIQAEEAEAQKLADSRRTVEPLKVKMIPISYSKMDDLVKQVTAFLSTRGKVVGDNRTSALIVTDIEESISKIEKLVQSLDIAPPQVLIEGKIVEAGETFERSVGINWGAAGVTSKIGKSKQGPINLLPTLAVSPGTSSASAFSGNFALGTLDILGDLSATLALNEKQSNVKVLSSPRIVTLHNQVAEITQVQEIPIISSIPQATGPAQKQVVFKPVQLKLNVTPQVTAEGGVMLNLDVMREFPGEIVDQETMARAVNRRSAKTTVLVQNGQTAVIGGIYQNDATISETGVPWLKDIPVLGYLFKSKSRTNEKTELLIFLTPKVLASSSPSNDGGSF